MKYKTDLCSKKRIETTCRCGMYFFRGNEGSDGERAGGLDQTTRANAKSPARLTTSLDGKKDERMYGESFKPGSHRDSSRQRTRHLRGREQDEGKERKMSEDGAPRRRGELFSNVSRRGGHRQAKETSARSKRVVRTKLRPSGKGNAGELEKFKCARL